MVNKVPLVIADFETSLASAISAGATSFTLASATDDDGNALAAGKYCFTVNNGSSNKQYLLGQLNGTTVSSVVYVDRRGNETSGAQYAARAGAPVIISDFATIQRVADILRGQENLDGDNPITYDAEPTLANRAEVATVGYVLDQVSGGTVNFDNQIISSSDAIAGETIAAGDWVFFQTSDQEWYKADADTVAEVDNVEIGVALGAGSDGASISGGIQKSGVYTTTGLTAGDTYYIGNTAGAITNSAGTTKRVIGVALSSTKLLMNPVSAVSVTSREKDALAGGGTYGSPSSTNKFLTQDWAASTASIRTTYDVADSPATWTKNSGLVGILVQAWGAGGGGGCNSTGGGGGGGGSYVEKYFTASELGATETITIGAGGTAVVGAASTGGAGGNTTFGSVLTAYGGGGGSTAPGGGGGGATSAGSSATGGTGGNGGTYPGTGGAGGNTSAGGDSVFGGAGGGDDGAVGGASYAGGGGGAGNNAVGGASYWGGGGGGGALNSRAGGTSTFGGNGGAGAASGTATTGSVPGGGGGGGYSSGASGAGGAGRVIVTEYYV